jgi:phosphatidylserine decarboxylase
MAPTAAAPTQKKTYKIKRALKSAARLRLPTRVSEGRGSGRNKLNPLPGEKPVVILRVQVIACQDLLSKDRSGTSDP